MEDNIKSFVINSIAETKQRIEEELKDIKSKRFFVKELENAITESGQRLFIISGLRGTGKTTGLYQIIHESDKQDSVYLSCDELVSRKINLEEIISTLDYIKKENIGIKKRFLLLLDEITYLDEWDLKLKILNDKRPNLIILATSSSAIPLRKTLAFTRRAYEIFVLPLSFCEYLMLKYGIVIPEELRKSIRKKILSGQSLEQEYIRVSSLFDGYNQFALYEEYVKHDLPFALKLSDTAYADSIKSIIKRTIYEDFSRYEKFETNLLTSAESMIKYISTIPCDGVKISTLSETIGLSKDSIVKLLKAFELGMIIKGLEYEGRNRMLKKPKKWFFYSSSMRYVLAAPVVSDADLAGNLREDSVFRHLLSFTDKLYYSHEADFLADKLKLEVGKGKKPREGVIMLEMSNKIEKNQIPIPFFALSV